MRELVYLAHSRVDTVLNVDEDVLTPQLFDDLVAPDPNPAPLDQQGQQGPLGTFPTAAAGRPAGADSATGQA